jgi:hypothetical protein
MCVFAYSSTTNKPLCTKLGIIIAWVQEKILEGENLRKIVLSSSPDEGDSCSFENKHDKE